MFSYFLDLSFGGSVEAEGERKEESFAQSHTVRLDLFQIDPDPPIAQCS